MSIGIGTTYFDINLYAVEPPILPESNDPFTINEDGTIDFNLTGIATIQKRLDVGIGGTILTTSTGNIGIGTTNPLAALDVNGNLIVRGNIGVGSTQPQQRIDVDGSIKIDENIYDSVNSPGSNGYFLSRDTNGIRWLPGNPDIIAGFYVQDEGQYIPLAGLAQSFSVLNFVQNNSQGIGTDTLIPIPNPSNPNFIADIQTQDLWGYNTSGEIYRMTGVGINTTNPNTTLDVYGTFHVTGASDFDTTLNVDGATTLNSTLDVDGATTLNSSLDVDGAATLNNSLDVDGATTLNSSLDVDGATTLNSTLDVDGITILQNTQESTDPDNGALQVKGGVGIKKDLQVEGDITTESNFYGQGENILGIVTQIVPSIGINIQSTQTPGKGVVTIDAYKPVGRTIYVSMNGDDDNTGLAENHPKRTVKSAASAALPGDTIKLFPGSYVEENPIILAPTVSIEGTELRNATLTPRYLDRDFFHLNNGCHITDSSFIGPNVTNGAAMVAFQPLQGVHDDRYFDAARLIRLNLDFIANETLGYLTSTSYRNPPFNLGVTSTTKCANDIKSVWKAVCHDITRGGNSKCVGAGLSYYNGTSLQHIVGVKTETIDAFIYSAGIAKSVVNNVQWNGNFQSNYTQVRDLSIQNDPITNSNIDINSCQNVISALYSCVGVVTNIVNYGPDAFSIVGFNTNFPGNSGRGFESVVGITSAVYNNENGKVTIAAPGYVVRKGDRVEIRDLNFSCSSNGSGISTQKFPSGKYGFEFYVDKVNQDNTFVLNVGVSTLPHNYVGGGYVVDRAKSVTNAVYDNVSGIVTITAPGAFVRVGDLVTLSGLGFTCPTDPNTVLQFPSGNLGYDFRVTSVIGVGTTFSAFVGSSTVQHNYVSGGIVRPPYSKGVGNIVQGPYVRNTTNFVGNSIGMKVDGFAAEPGDAEDIGVTGAMSVDSYTQYNQGGIGVSITNGSYCQLVSIFTICDDIAIYTGSGGQCDITNSNSSFGRLGLVAEGVGDNTTRSIYRYTGEVVGTAEVDQDIVVVSGIGSNRPYDGQAIYFGDLFYTIQNILITNGGSGYSGSTGIIIETPDGPNGTPAEALATIDNGVVTAIDLISSGSQFTQAQVDAGISISFTGGGSNATAVAIMEPVYYNIESATLPSAGVSTMTLTTNLNNTIGAGTTVYFSRLSLQIASSHSFEWVGAGNDIFKAKPGLGGVAIQENEVVRINGGQVVYTSTDQAGNFKIGDDFTINQLTGTITGRAFNQSLLNTVTPVIIALAN
jgi:cytoskeletal protein CcmA (bactofilin family)